MDWRSILKNASLATGLNMRSMDLDNIIEEEDDCFKRFEKTIENFEKEKDVVVEDITKIFFKIVKDLDIPDSVFCKILNAMKGIPLELKSLKENTDEQYHISWYDYAEELFLKTRVMSRPNSGYYTGSKKIHCALMVGHEDYTSYAWVGVYVDELEEFADIIRRCVA